MEAVSWHGRSSTVSKPQASPAPCAAPAHAGTAAPSTALVSPLQGATTGGALVHMQAGSAVVAAQPQQAVAVPVMMATATLAAAPAGAAVRHQQGRQNPSKHASHTPVPTGLGTGLTKGPTSRHQVDNDSELLQSASAEEHGVRRDRESLGGTQGAITGLAHMALQRHDQAVQLPTASADHSAGYGLDSQQMALQVSSFELKPNEYQTWSQICGAKIFVDSVWLGNIVLYCMPLMHHWIVILSWFEFGLIVCKCSEGGRCRGCHS